MAGEDRAPVEGGGGGVGGDGGSAGGRDLADGVSIGGPKAAGGGATGGRDAVGSGDSARRDAAGGTGIAGSGVAGAYLPPPLYPLLYESLVMQALAEDLGRAGDLTSDAVLPPGLQAEAQLVARAPGRLAGVEVALAAFRLLDPALRLAVHARDGEDCARGQALATVHGAARSILSAERTALNLLGRLSGIATATRDLAAAVAPWGARIVCTRKTTPGLRALEKYAVRMGGGRNHRFGLDDAVLIKDNHRALAGGLAAAVARARAAVGHLVK